MLLSNAVAIWYCYFQDEGGVNTSQLKVLAAIPIPRHSLQCLDLGFLTTQINSTVLAATDFNIFTCLFQLLGFVSRSDLHLHQFMGPTFVIVPQQTTDYIDSNALQVFGLLVVTLLRVE